MKRINVTILIAAILMATAAACEMENENESENGNRVRLVPVETINIQPDSFDDYIRVSGIVEAIEDATISSENSGRILSIRQRGELVRQGEIIANMDDRLSRAQFEAAQTNFELANDTYERLQSLYEEEIISTQDYQSARAQRDQARAQMNQAEKQLRDTHIEAPFTGRIEERFVNTGELINPGMPVVRLVNSDIVRITAGIPERYASQIKEGTRAQINLRAGSDASFESQVTFVGNVIDSATRTLPVEIEISNVDGAIKPEMVVDIHIKRETIENAIIVPRTAIVRDESGTNLFVVRNDNGVKEAELVPVTTGFASGPIIEILEGLLGGDEVVITGISTLTAGDQLNIVNNSNSNDKVLELQRRDRTTVSF
jgi:membrane fusion protein, multidrug efflux system